VGYVVTGFDMYGIIHGGVYGLLGVKENLIKKGGGGRKAYPAYRNTLLHGEKEQRNLAREVFLSNTSLELWKKEVRKSETRAVPEKRTEYHEETLEKEGNFSMPESARGKTAKMEVSLPGGRGNS